MKKILFVLLLFVFLLCGCIENSYKELRYECLILSSYSSQSIVECNNQEDCYNKVNNFFGVDEKEFEYPANIYFHEYKNHLARSWFYYNKSLKNIREIHRICNNTDLNEYELKDEVDDFINNFTFSVEETQKANKKAIELIISLKKYLDKEEIPLTKEEPWFISYSILEKNILILKGIERIDEETYVGRFLKETNRLDELAKKVGFQRRLMSDLPIVQYFDYFENKVPYFENIGPFNLSQFLREFIDYISERSILEEANSILRSSNAFEFFNIYDSLVGKSNSLPSLLKDNLLSYIKAKKIFYQNIDFLFDSLDKNILYVEDKLNYLYSKEFDRLDSNFLKRLIDISPKSTSISAKNFAFESLGGEKEELVKKLYQLKSEFSSIKEQYYLNKISLGRLLLSLKQNSLKIFEIKNNVDFLSSEFLLNLDAICKERLEFIKRDVSQERDYKLISLSASLLFNIENFEKENKLDKRIILCYDAINKYDEYLFAKDSYQRYLAFEKAKLDNCFVSLKEFFKDNSNQKNYPDSLLQRFNYLKEILKDNNNLIYLLDSCEELKKDILDYFLDSEDMKQFVYYYKESKQYLSILQKLNAYMNRQQINRYNNLAELIKTCDFFDNNDNLTIFLKCKDLEINVVYNNIKSLFYEVFISYLEKKANYEIVCSSFPEIDNNVDCNIIISFVNNIANIDEDFVFSLPVNLDKITSIVYKDNHIKEVFVDANKITIDFSFVPLGKTLLILSFNSMIAKSYNEQKLVYATLSNAVFKRQVTVHIKQLYSNDLKGKNCFNLNNFKVSDVYVVSDSLKSYFLDDNGCVVYIIKPRLNKEDVFIYFSILQPFEYSFKLESQNSDENYTYYFYKAILMNRLDVDLENAKIEINFAKGADNVDIYDDSFTKVVTESLNSSLIFRSSFLPKQRKTFYISFKVRNYQDFWVKKISDTISKLLSINKKDSNQLIEELKSYYNKDLRDNKTISSLIELLNRSDNFIRSCQIEESEKSKLDALYYEVLEKRNKLKNSLDVLERLKLIEDYNILNSILQNIDRAMLDFNNYYEKKDYQKAKELLYYSLSLLSGASEKSLQNTLFDKWIELKKQFDLLLADSIGIEKKIFKEKSDALENTFNKYLKISDINSAADVLNEFSVLLKSLSESNSKNKENICNDNFRIYNENNELLLKSEQLLTKLSDNLNSLPDGFFESISYVPPFSKSDLDSYSKKLSQQRTKILLITIDENSCIDQNNKKVLESINSNLNDIFDRISRDYNKLKKDAEEVIFLAKLKKDSSLPNKKADELFEKAKEFLSKQEFLKAIAYAKASTEAYSFREPTANLYLANFPFSIVLILLILILFLILKFRETKGQRTVRILRDF
ncbi:MAG: hypothetical protein N3D73_02360 [Candidatus Diapherotrites archaeon]|nr:hypothetical protein [Candidatus Diapherotrites archaeon]